MIRPVTCLAMLMAAGSGLYLYQAKHQGYVLDHQIEQISQSTAKLRAHIAVLRAEYALLNDPSRLQQLAAAHLPELAPLAPGQFTTLAQVDDRLPPVQAPPAPPAPLDVSAPGADGAAGAAPAVIGVSAGGIPYDYPPAPARPPVARPETTRPDMARALVASALAPTPHVAPPRRARTPSYAPPAYANAARALPHRFAAASRPDPLAIQAAAPPIASAPSQVASALGMARGLSAPPAVGAFQRYRPGAAETLAR